MHLVVGCRRRLLWRHGAQRGSGLPAGVELYRFAVDGTATATDVRGTRSLNAAPELHRFIDDGQLPRYFVGAQDTSPQRPSNATYKLGIVAPHSAFTPHAHGSEHFVLSLGYAGLRRADRWRWWLVLTLELWLRAYDLTP